MPTLKRKPKQHPLPTVPGLQLPCSPDRYLLALNESIDSGKREPLTPAELEAVNQLVITCEALSDNDPQPEDGTDAPHN